MGRSLTPQPLVSKTFHTHSKSDSPTCCNFLFPSLSIIFKFCSAGWGGPGGYVYQKAYLEFFCSKDKLDLLVEKSKALPSVTYIAVNKEGQCVSNVGPNTVNAVTWGVFPGKEIIQPTVVDLDSFIVWKDEAFEIWTRGWACLFPEGDPARGLLEQVINLIKIIVPKNSGHVVFKNSSSLILLFTGSKELLPCESC